MKKWKIGENDIKTEEKPIIKEKPAVVSLNAETF
jgi:hypothetical protein